MSYANVILFSMATPTYDDVKESKENKKFDETLDANNPANINIIGGEEIVRI